jgi:small GTP-binding protein
MINPGIVFKAGRMAVAGAKKAGGAILTGGAVAHNWLKERMPLEDPSSCAGESDFSPLNVRVSQNLDYKIKLLESTAQTLDQPEYVSMVKSIVDQINDDSFTVLFAGRFNAGKSTLLNKLLERGKILKTSNGETTKTLAWLQYAEEGREWSCYHDFEDTMHSIIPEEIAAIPEEPPVFNVFAGIHAEILKHNAILIDTPGLEASDEAAALTIEALENADAVVLVVDHFPVSKHDKRFIERLQKTGKTEKLFVVVNKMDKVPQDERDGLINSRIKMLSEMGVRTRVFPLSCTDDQAVENGFSKFRAALLEYIETGLQDAREAVVSRRVSNAAKTLQELCKEAVDFGKIHDAHERTKIKEERAACIREAERETAMIIRSNQAEIRRLQQEVLGKWFEFFGSLKDEVAIAIQNAGDEQLNHPNQLLGHVQTNINNFLMEEFAKAENQVCNNITRALNGIQLPIPQQEGQLAVSGLTRWDKNFKIPAEFGTLGMMAFTFFTKAHGFFSTIACLPNLYLIWILSPFINKMFEQLVKTLGGVGSSMFKTQLQKKINDQWPVVDDNVQTKINAYFHALSDQMERAGREAVTIVTGSDRSILADNFAGAEKLAEMEKYQQQLGAIAQ